MRIGNLKINETVDTIILEARKIKFFREHSDLERVKKCTTEHLLLKGENYFENYKQLQKEGKIIFVIYAWLCKFNYFLTFPDWNELADTSLKRIMDSDTNIVNNILPCAREVKKYVYQDFICAKRRLIGDEIFVSAYNYIDAHRTGLQYVRFSSVANEEQIRTKMLDTFIQNYDVKEDWKKFINSIYKKVEASFHGNNGDPAHFGDLIGNDEDESIDIEDNIKYQNEAPDTFEEIEQRIWLYDTLRDLGLYIKKFKDTKTRTKSFVCFFTDDISYLLNESNYFYKHLQEHEKSYNAAVNIDFLNFFIDCQCSSILDAYNKKRKPKSTFNTNDTQNDNEPCGYPLELYVFADFFDMSKGTFSNYRDDYNKFRREYMKNSV